MSGGSEERPPLGTGGAGEDRAGHQNITGDSLPRDAAGAYQNSLGPDTGAALDFLDHLCGDGLRVLTSILPDGGRTTTATFAPRDRDRMAAWIDERQGVQNIYFTVNALYGPVTSKPNKGAVSAIRAVHVDVDPRPGEPLDAERERAERLLREFDPAPTVIIDSGGGFQGFWLLDEECPVGGSAELARLFRRGAQPGARGALTDAEREEVDAHEARLWEVVEARNLKVEANLQADACHNADRIMRLPGTVNLPGDKKRKKGRTARVASVVFDDWARRHRLEDLAPAPKPSGNVGATRRAVTERPAVGVDLDALPVDDLCRRVIVNGHDPDNPTRWDGALDPDGTWRGDRSKAVFWVACEMARRGCSEAHMLGVLLDPDLAISCPIPDDHIDPRRSALFMARLILREVLDGRRAC